MLEALLTKIMNISVQQRQEQQQQQQQQRCPQVICMSATMSGLELLSNWLCAQLFMTNFRPVPLAEHAVFCGHVYVLDSAAAGVDYVACIPGQGLYWVELCSSVT